jgi:PTS system nitrogen regulatory IIA component
LILDIKDLLSPARVEFNLKSRSKEDVVRELVDILYKDGKLYNKQKFIDAVFKREKEFSTGIGMGIAIPHGKDESVKEPALTFGMSKEGIDYKAYDGTLAYLFFLISVPLNSDDMHLKVLSMLSRKLMHDEVREALMKAKSYEEVINAFGK